jgi:hypothetical protein
MSTLKFNKWQSIDGVTRNAVLQVVSKEVTGEVSTPSTSFVDATDMFLAITPTSATSKILISISAASSLSRSSASGYMAHRILRNSTEIFNPSGSSAGAFYSTGWAGGGLTTVNLYTLVPIVFLDAPATIEEITYKLQFLINQNTSSGVAYINRGGMSSTITLMEIAQ